MPEFAVPIFVAAAVAVLVGAAFVFGPSVGMKWFGKLPGDFRVEGRNATLFFPIATCIVLSLILTALLFVASRLR